MAKRAAAAGRTVPAVQPGCDPKGDATAAPSRLLSCSPAIKARVVAPVELRLVFGERLMGRISRLEVTDARGRSVATGPTRLTADRCQLVAELPRLLPGSYRVAWSVVAEDRGQFGDSYGFTVDDAPDPLQRGLRREPG